MYSHCNRSLGRMAIGPHGAMRNVFLVPMVYIAGDVFVLAAFHHCRACFTVYLDATSLIACLQICQRPAV